MDNDTMIELTTQKGECVDALKELLSKGNEEANRSSCGN